MPRTLVSGKNSKASLAEIKAGIMSIVSGIGEVFRAADVSFFVFHSAYNVDRFSPLLYPLSGSILVPPHISLEMLSTLFQGAFSAETEPHFSSVFRRLPRTERIQFTWRFTLSEKWCSASAFDVEQFAANVKRILEQAAAKQRLIDVRYRLQSSLALASRSKKPNFVDPQQTDYLQSVVLPRVDPASLPARVVQSHHEPIVSRSSLFQRRQEKNPRMVEPIVPLDIAALKQKARF